MNENEALQINILRAERDGSVARLATTERDRDEWKRRAIQAEGMLADIDDLKRLLTEMLSNAIALENKC